MNKRNTHFPMVLYSQADSELKAIYDDIMCHFEMDFVLNYFKAQGSNIPLLKGNWEKLKSVIFCGTVPRLVKEEIIYRISRQRNCDYCRYVHTKVIEDLHKQAEHLQGHQVNAGLSPDQEDAINLVTKMAFDTSPDIQSYCDRLITLGFNSDQVPELLAVADLTTMLNMQAIMSGIEIDEELLNSQPL